MKQTIPLTQEVNEKEQQPVPYLANVGPILLLGAPGAGKGTQAKELMAAWNVPQISTGDILRELRKDPVRAATPIGRQVCAVMDAGKLVSDEMVEHLVLERLARPDTRYVLDGFPRTLEQAAWLDHELADHAGTPPVIAVLVKVSYTVLLQRTTGRRMCPVCGHIYNIYFQPPRTDDKCDMDGAGLVHRTDDTEVVFAERYHTYDAMTAPVVEHYHHSGRFAEVDGERPLAEVTRSIMDAIVRLRGQR
jgi:adenylate kinase